MVEVTFIDRAGLAALTAAHRQAHDAGTSLLLRTAPAQMPRLIALLGLDPAADSHPSCSTTDLEGSGPSQEPDRTTFCP